jgi:hypothetical protein
LFALRFFQLPWTIQTPYAKNFLQSCSDKGHVALSTTLNLSQDPKRTKILESGLLSSLSSQSLAVLSNPISVKGTGNAFEGLIGQIMGMDHLYNTIGKTSAIGVVGMGPTSFLTSLYYQSTFPAGIQEGILVLNAHSNANGSIATAVMDSGSGQRTHLSVHK